MVPYLIPKNGYLVGLFVVGICFGVVGGLVCPVLLQMSGMALKLVCN